MSGFRHLRDEVLHRGHVIDLCRSTCVAPDGTEFDREVVRHPGAVSVVALTDSGDVVLVRQYRAALDVDMLEIPAGKRDVADEPLEETVRRELIEEVGLVPGRLDQLIRFHNSVGFTDEESFIFLARDLSSTDADHQGIEESYLRVEQMPLEESLEMIRSGDITDAKTVLGLTFAAAHPDLAG